MGDTIDVLVVGKLRMLSNNRFKAYITSSLGASWGTGHRGGKVSSLICAVKDEEEFNLSGEQKFNTFVRIGTGLTLADYNWINTQPWKPFNKDNPPRWLELGETSTEDRGDVYLERAQ